MIKSFNCFLIILSLYACSLVPKDVSTIKNASGENKKELERAIHYFRTRDEKEKLKGLYFLVGNLENKYTIGGAELRKFDPLFSFFQDLRKNNLQVTRNSVFVRAKWDSLFSKVGSFKTGNPEIIPDYQKIKAEYLINDINLAFKIRDSVPWGRQIPFDQFCEYVLAYRFSHEPLEEWRKYYYEKYKKLRDTIRHDSIRLLAAGIHKYIPRIESSSLFLNYAFDFWIEQLETGQIGTCKQIATSRAQIMRAAGIPTAIDFTPAWGNQGASHYWNSILLENGEWYHYEGTLPGFGQELVYRVAKVYRKTFGRQQISYNGYENEIPQEICQDHIVDVTPEYTKTFNIKVALRYPAQKKMKYAVICCSYDRNWVPVDFGAIRNGRAVFKNMGVGNLYLVQYYNNGNYIPASDPFILGENGNTIFVNPNLKELQVLNLTRKYPLRKSIQTYHEGVTGCYFQGSSHKDFKVSQILHTIHSAHDHIVHVKISNAEKFRYVRYKSPFHSKGDIAEVEFYGGDKRTDTTKLSGKIMGSPEVPVTFGTPYTNAFDGNIDTYFHGYWFSKLWWAGLDLGDAKFISEIRYCPRSDTNFIIENDQYELCYWSNKGWISLGKQTADLPFLVFKNVPHGGLYILHNLSRGKEERVFTWEGGKQVFW